MNAWLTSEVRRIELSSLALASEFIVTPAMLEVDGVHLKPASGEQFVASLLQSVMNLQESRIDVTLVDDLMVVSDDDASSVPDEDRLGAILKIVKGNSRQLSSIRPLRETLVKLDERTSAFETQVRLRRQRDNLVFARIKEEADAELNRSRENRVVVSGLDRASSDLTSHKEKKDHYAAVLSKLILKACPDLDPKPSVIDVIVNFQRAQASPTIEAKLDSVSGAHAFRRAASQMAKSHTPDFANLYFSNSVTQATRVRIEILKALAKKLTTETESAYVQGFISRPVLRYLSEDPTANLTAGTGRSYSFVDAVSRYGDLLQAQDLVSAYKRAGGTFRGAMEQYFVVLSEVEDTPVASGSNRAPLGTPGRGGPRGRGARNLSRGFARGRKRPGQSPPNSPFGKKTMQHERGEQMNFD